MSVVRPAVLVVDDEPQIQRFLRHALEAAGYAVTPAETAAQALRAVRLARPDLIILDLGLPDLDGKSVLGQLRQNHDTPVIVLSARGEEEEKVAALDLGANDYIEKPFGIGELLARVRAALRPRGGARRDDIIVVGPIRIDRAAHVVTKRGEPLRLTPKEFELLALLASHAGRVMTHRTLLQAVWGPAHTDDVAYLRVFVGQLRQKVEDNPAEPALILTETGVGYRFASGPESLTAEP